MKLKTAGIHPKLIAAVVTGVVTYLLGQTVLDLPAWAVVAGQAVLIGTAAFVAPAAATTTTRVKRATRKKAEAGLTFIEVVIVLLVLAVVALAVIVL